MTDFSLGARLHLGANSNRAFSLPQSFVAAKRRQKPAPSSEGAEAAPAADRGGYLGGAQGATIGSARTAPPQSTEFAKVQTAIIEAVPPAFFTFQKILKTFLEFPFLLQ